jgi:hypothetical protein
MSEEKKTTSQMPSLLTAMRALRSLDACDRGEHKLKIIDRSEKEEFLGCIIYETCWCEVCGSLVYTSHQFAGGTWREVKIRGKNEPNALGVIKNILLTEP